ncbi:MAG: L-rhamnose mutarotase [Clostridia bacterium]
MVRFGQLGELKPDKIAEYKELHAAVWPEVLATIKACRLANYSIYLMGHQVVAYFEYMGNDYEADMKKMADDPATQAWWTHTKPCFVGHAQRIYYRDMEEIFHQP